MTRREAIKHLERLQTIGNLSDETLSAFSNAIIALERWDGAENTLDKVLEIIDEEIKETIKNDTDDTKGADYEFFRGYLDALDTIRNAAKELSMEC